jgi:hypothetical protein
MSSYDHVIVENLAIFRNFIEGNLFLIKNSTSSRIEIEQTFFKSKFVVLSSDGVKLCPSILFGLLKANISPCKYDYYLLP